MAEDFTHNEETNTQGGDRTFTQEDVNRIVQERLAKERSKQEPVKLSLEEREKALTAKENKFTCREILSEQKMPERLLEVLDTSDPDRFKASLAVIKELYDPYHGKPIPRVVSTTSGLENSDTEEDLRGAFGLPPKKE